MNNDKEDIYKIDDDDEDVIYQEETEEEKEKKVSNFDKEELKSKLIKYGIYIFVGLIILLLLIAIFFPKGSKSKGQSSGKEIKLTAGDKYNLDYSSGSYTWTSSNQSVAKVTDNGEIEALKNGDATIVIKKGSETITYIVHVEKIDEAIVVTNVVMEKNTIELEVDEEYEMKRRKERLRLLKQSYASFFKAFDTIFFGQEYALHQTIAGLDADGDNVLLEDVFGIRFSGTHNPYIRRLAGFLHQTSVKGNLPMLGFYVRCILGERVSMDVVQKKAVADQPSESYAFVRFVVHIEGLSNEAYNLRMEQYGVFFRLLFRWFLPFDCECDYCIKDRSQRFVLDDAPLTLDYNTQLF